jgi:NADP-dependent 3-hydroxy acid dehydrogenase YdfG
MQVARNEPALQGAAAAIEAAGGTAGYAVADVGLLAEVEAAAHAAVARSGRTLGSAMPALRSTPSSSTPPCTNTSDFPTNYFGTVHGALTALRHLRDQGGTLITIGSTASDLPTTVMSVYAASKHTVKAYVDSLRIEVNDDTLPISITLINPSGIDMPIGAHAANHLSGGTAAGLYPRARRRGDPRRGGNAAPRRHGVDRPQMLIGEHFPRLLDRFGGLLAPFLHDSGKPNTKTENLAQPARDGEIHLKTDHGRSFSLYTSTSERKPLIAAIAVAGEVSAACCCATADKGGRSGADLS